ncbi:DUF4276 family protein [Pseudomonas sp. 102515]|jgi:hypothetical protein|uniref:DUF4276 family protein n=1 Tax=Pseudomonas sp. 102515 TaxID=3071568 RepID=UPI002800AB38|nr:DUF4276 family protein [Pseudomonas sp. 102515]MDQ7914694.1 DUF4276 family protein [Pseudomonas sp. 102515]
MSIKIGIIAEDLSDIQVITELISKYMEKNKFSVKHFVGKGCGKLKTKCSAWVDNLSMQGCTHVIIFHDLDRNKEALLRKEIEQRILNCNFKETHVVIPTEELEAWLLSDPSAIKTIFSIKGEMRISSDVESIKSPKEHLQKLIKKHSNKTYINTIHNKKIAEKIDISKLANCPSYRDFEKYITEKVAR